MMLWYSVPEERLRVRSVGKTVTGFRIALAALLCAPLLAYSAGLGRFTVNSGLGQPLNAEIEIVSLQSGEEDSLSARLASADAFRQAGIELSSALVGLQFSIDKSGGRPIIRLRTVQPVNEPFLDILVELQWATGRLVREYTFLLDPPEYRGLKPVPAAPPVAAPAAKPAPAAPVAVPTPAKPEAPRPESRALAPTPPAAGAKQEEVQKGDTLGAIARRNKPDGVTLNQMLIALYRANEDAFIRGNINLVRAGRILNVPDREAVLAINAADANQVVQSHMSDFADYKRQLGAVVAAAPAAPVREREVTGRITTKPAAPEPAEQKDQLKLSKADPAKPASAAAKAAREDDRVSRERALKESQSRVGDLEKNVADLQKLLEMKNQQLAELEKRAAAKPAPAPAPVPAPAAKAPEAPKEAPKVEAPKAAAKDAPKEAAKDAPKEVAKEAPKEAPKDAVKEAPKEVAKEAPKDVAKEAPKDAPKAPVKDIAKDTAAKKPAAKAAPEKSFIEEYAEDPMFLGGLGVVVLLLGGYGAWAWRKKKSSQSQFQDSVLGAATGAGASSVFAPASPQAPDTPQPEAAGSQASAGGASVAPADSGEVDPIAEADVYMAYGRDAQAEEILKEALAKDPNRSAVYAKLLEIFANRKDAKNFEDAALKLKGLTNSSGPEWEKAMVLGHSIDPGNGLYGGAATEAAPAAGPAAAAPVLDFDIGGGAEPAPEAKPDAGGLDFDIGAAAAAPATDFASGGTLKLDTSNTQPAAGSGLDFDLGGGGAAEDDGEKTMLMPRKAAPAAADPDATVAMDFDLNLDLGGAKDEPAKPADAPIDLGGLSLDLGTPGGGGGGNGGDAKWQEVATKLDLAKAYQEMGDKDGARELLNEVVKEGDAAQQGQAQQMLSSLG
jgi:pilus assembly protein FimV